jgi:DNA-binding beta-propeller fold protein YncE
MIALPGQNRIATLSGAYITLWNSDTFLLTGSLMFPNEFPTRFAVMDNNRFAILARSSVQIFSFDQLQQNTDCGLSVTTDSTGITHYRLGVALTDVATDGRRIFASVRSNACSWGNSVVAFDGSTQKIIPVGSDPTAIALSPDGSTLYVGLEGSISVARINTRQLTLTDTVPLSSQPVGYPGSVRVQALSGSMFAGSFADGPNVTLRVFDGNATRSRFQTHQLPD